MIRFVAALCLFALSWWVATEIERILSRPTELRYQAMHRDW
jgi:hypothetical protein